MPLAQFSGVERSAAEAEQESNAKHGLREDEQRQCSNKAIASVEMCSRPPVGAGDILSRSLRRASRSSPIARPTPGTIRSQPDQR